MVDNQQTDADWEAMGAADPYFSVITHDKYHKENLDPNGIEDFFESGRRHVATLMEGVPANHSRQRALDFGCGVGRVAIPLSKHFREVVGADVSQSMLQEANRNRAQHHADNVSFVQTSDSLDEIEGAFDLVHTFIVLQHIPVARGNAIFSRLVDLIAPGGFGSIHMTYSKSTHSSKLASLWPPAGPNGEVAPLQLRKRLRTGWRRVRKQLKQTAAAMLSTHREKPHGLPAMQMNPYTLNPLFHTLQENNVTQIAIRLSDHGGEYGTNLFFQKPLIANNSACKAA